MKSKIQFSIYIFLIYFLGAILQTLSFLVIYYFSPTLLILTDIITPLLLWIIDDIIMIKEVVKTNLIFLGCGYSLTLIASLIYNEIIIFNFCGFNKYTKKYLEEKQNEEFLILRRTEMENSKVDNNENNNQNDNDNENDNDNDNDNDFVSENESDEEKE